MSKISIYSARAIGYGVLTASVAGGYLWYQPTTESNVVVDLAIAPEPDASDIRQYAAGSGVLAIVDPNNPPASVSTSGRPSWQKPGEVSHLATLDRPDPMDRTYPLSPMRTHSVATGDAIVRSATAGSAMLQPLAPLPGPFAVQMATAMPMATSARPESLAAAAGTGLGRAVDPVFSNTQEMVPISGGGLEQSLANRDATWGEQGLDLLRGYGQQIFGQPEAERLKAIDRPAESARQTSGQLTTVQTARPPLEEPAATPPSRSPQYIVQPGS